MLHPKIKKFISAKPAGGSRFLVFGAPGTGKTFQLIKLIEYAVKKEKMDPKKILVFCFNRRWAKIIREKTAEIIGKSFFEIPVTTFFSYCNKLIEQYNLCSQPTVILNAPGQWKLLSETIQEINDIKKYPLTYRFINSSSFVSKNYMQEVFDFILRAQENLIEPKNFLDRLTASSPPVLYELGGIYLKYLQTLKKRGLYNYGRLLTEALDILELKTGNNCMPVFDLVIADELQEFNKAQLKITDKVSENIKCVYFGNDDQATYAFRGSAVNNFSRIYSDIAYRVNGHDNILHLDSDYRAVAQINEFCSSFISLNEDRIKKCSESRLKKTPEKQGSSSGGILMKEFRNVLEEANFISGHIKKLIFLNKIKAEDICIVIKGKGYKTGVLENILSRNGILFSRRSSRSILDNQYVKFMVDFALLANLVFADQKNNTCPPAGRADKINSILERLLASDISGINPFYIKRLAAPESNLWKSVEGLMPGKILKDKNFYNPVLRDLNNYDENIKKIIKYLKSIQKFCLLQDMDAFDFFAELINDENIGIVKKPVFNKKIPGYRKAGIINIVGDFMQSVKIFCSDNPGKNSIGDYLEFLDQIRESGFLEEIEESTKEITSAGLVNIMSYHQCKGLEFDAVFLPFVNKDYLPSVYKDNQLYDTQVFNYMAEGKTIPGKILKKKHFEDERKLFYTGMSRAKKFLIITAVKAEAKSSFFEEAAEIKNSINKKTIRRKEKQAAGNLSSAKYCFHGLNYGWLERKKAIVCLLRFYGGRHTDFNRMIQKIVYLKFAYPPEKWWSLADITVNDKSSYGLYPPSFSYSSLNTYMQCPRKYKYRFFFGLEIPESIHAMIGILYHAIIKKFLGLKSGQLSWSRLESIIRTEFSSKEFAYRYLQNKLLVEALENFRNYYDKYVPQFSPDVMLEKKFAFVIGNKKINGRIDQVKIIDKNTAELIDFKSGNTGPSYKDVDSEIQLPLYRLAIDKSPDLKMLRSKNLEMKYIFLGSQDCRELFFMHENFDFKNFEEKISNLMQKIENEEFSRGPDDKYICKNCEFELICKGKSEIDS
jgi:superfamily I DNA/RNA helicase/CRISPR/Cas system-associated exonuclease Cas4 (RecB family)